jgi:gamma-glutamyltranspeptidase/glutathione hydrolase
MSRPYFTVISLFCVLSAMTNEIPLARGSQLYAAGYDRPDGDPHQSRSVVVAKHGIVATSHPLAAQAGLDVLKSGGNASDAGIGGTSKLWHRG